MTFSIADTPGASGFLVKAQLWTSQTANVAAYRLYLFTVPETSLTVPADNAAYTTLYAERSYLLGYLDFPAVADATGAGSSTTAISQVIALSMPFYTRGVPGYGSTKDMKIYGVLVTETTFTPDSAQTYCVELVADVY